MTHFESYEITIDFSGAEFRLEDRHGVAIRLCNEDAITAALFILHNVAPGRLSDETQTELDEKGWTQCQTN